jgi:hypothetical protein
VGDRLRQLEDEPEVGLVCSAHDRTTSGVGVA